MTLPAYTVALTSCGRFDLLARTLRSLDACLDPAPAEIVVIEDSGDEAARGALEGLRAPARLILNRPQLGQMRAIDRLYETIRTDWVFHCEDDWEFTRGGFIAESFALLEALPQASMVGLRPRAELNPLVRGAPMERLGDVAFFRLDPRLHPEYFGYSFNPGLRRLADFRRFAPVAALGGEEDVSWAFKQAGFQIVNLETPAVRHIGDERHVDDPTARPKARDLGQRLARSLRKRLKRARRALGLR